MNQKVIITVVVTLILLGGGLVFVLSQKNSSGTESTQPTTSTPSQSSQTSDPDTPVSSDAESGITINFTNDGFEFVSYSVKAGSVVTVKNTSDRNVQFSSDDHPTHLKNTEMNLEELAPGESASFTATKKGSHSFHDHLNDHFGGTLVVE